MIDQDTFARQHHVPIIEGISAELPEGKGRDVLDALVPFFSRYHDTAVLHGAWSASRLFLGAEKIRTIPAIVDIVCIPDALEEIVTQEGFQFEQDEQVFIMYAGPVAFRLEGGKIGDWPLDAAYYSGVIPFSLDGVIVPVAAPEYTIALLLRHACQSGMVLEETALLDCVNLVAGPFERDGIKSLDLDLLSDLTLHMSGYRAEDLFKQLADGASRLRYEGIQEKTVGWIKVWKKRFRHLIEIQV